MRRFSIFSLIFIVLGFVIIACQGIGGQTTKPTVIIASPPSGSVYSQGEEVVIQSTSTDPAGITKVAVLVDGNQVREDPSPVSQGQAQFSLIQSWIADQVGQHTITIRATNTQGVTAESGILVNVKEQTSQQPTAVISIATAVPLATLPPATDAPLSPSAPSPTPQVTVLVVTATAPAVTDVPPATTAPTCVLNAKFIADLTIPDGTIFTPGAVFTKSWRVQNNGTCEWQDFSLVYTGGTQMAAGTVFPVPATQPGATADLSVPMTVPGNYGGYSANYRLRSAAGQVFGTNLTVVISVPAPATAVPPTHTPPPTVAGCSGQPNDFSFTVSNSNINPGQSVTLTWGAVTNASEVRLDGGEFNNEGVAAPGNRTVSPAATTEYKLTAKCNNSGQTRQKSVTVTVNAPVANFAGQWVHNFGTMNLNQNGNLVAGTYSNAFTGGSSTVQGTVSGNTLTGFWGNNDGTLEFTLSGDGKRFTGNWDTTEQWCGARPGQSFPGGCSFAGKWNTAYGVNTPCSPMNLTRKDNTITGTYCNGTITGTISYQGGGSEKTVLTGTWKISAVQTGPLVFYIDGYNAIQFQGNYSTNNPWCGWRDGSSKPGTCFLP